MATKTEKYPIPSFVISRGQLLLRRVVAFNITAQPVLELRPLQPPVSRSRECTKSGCPVDESRHFEPLSYVDDWTIDHKVYDISSDSVDIPSSYMWNPDKIYLQNLYLRERVISVTVELSVWAKHSFEFIIVCLTDRAAFVASETHIFSKNVHLFVPSSRPDPCSAPDGQLGPTPVLKQIGSACGDAAKPYPASYSHLSQQHSDKVNMPRKTVLPLSGDPFVDVDFCQELLTSFSEDQWHTKRPY